MSIVAPNPVEPNPAEESIFNQRSKELSDLYKEMGSMLKGMATKRKKTGSEDDEDLKAPEKEYDPVESAFEERNTILRDAASILDQDPELKRIRRIQPQNRPDSFGRFIDRASDHRRRQEAVMQKRTQGEPENIPTLWPPVK